jgi:hypothetical protein
MDFLVGSDILDIGSRRAELKAKRTRGSGFAAEVNNRPTHFDVPNVSDVRWLLYAVYCSCNTIA